MDIGKRAFGALNPMTEDMGGGIGSNVNRAVMGGLGRYEQGKNDIMGHHNKVQAQLSHLRRPAPELDL